MTVRWEKRDTLAVCSIAALALAVRLVLAAMTDVIGTDASSFLLFARDMTYGQWGGWLRKGIHPGYPVAIALAGSLIGNLERGAYIVSVFASSASVVPFHALVRDIAGRRVAILSALGVACFPPLVLEHADIMAEGLFHLFFLSAIALAWFAVVTPRPAFHALAGCVGALAYFTRPEGAYVPIAAVGLAVLALAGAWWRRRPARPLALAHATLAAVLFVAVSSPMLLALRNVAGEWTLTWRGSAAAAMSAFRKEPPPPELRFSNPRERGVLAAAGRTGAKLMQVKALFLLPLLLPGLWFLRGGMRPLGAVYLGSIAVGYVIAPLMATLHGYPVSHRQLLVPTLCAFPFAAVGCIAVVDRLALRWNEARVRLGSAVTIGILFAGMIAVTVQPRRVEERPVRDAALWLRERTGPNPVVYCNTERAGWYLGAPVRHLPDARDELLRLHLAQGEHLLVVEELLRRQIADGPGILETQHLRLTRFPQGSEPSALHVSVFARAPWAGR